MKYLKLIVAGLILFIPQTLLVWWNKSIGQMVIFLICAVFIVVLMYKEDIKEFTVSGKGLHVELQEAINEAYATIENIKKITEPLLTYSLKLMHAQDLAFRGTDTISRLSLFYKALEISQELKIEDDEFDVALSLAKSSILYSFREDFLKILEGQYLRAGKKDFEAGEKAKETLGNSFKHTKNVPFIFSCNIKMLKENIKLDMLDDEEKKSCDMRFRSLEDFLNKSSGTKFNKLPNEKEWF